MLIVICRFWLEESSTGLTLRTMTLVAFWRSMSFTASCMLPSPNAITVMTAAVPMMMPSTESIDRRLCSYRLRIASTKRARDLSQKKDRNLIRRGGVHGGFHFSSGLWVIEPWVSRRGSEYLAPGLDVS